MRSLPDPAGGLTAPPRPPAVLHAAAGSVGLGHRGSHSPREKPPTKVLHQAPHIGNPALAIGASGIRPLTFGLSAAVAGASHVSRVTSVKWADSNHD